MRWPAFVRALGYNWFAAVAIGFIALSGVAAETGVVMLLRLNQTWDVRMQQKEAPTVNDLDAAIMEGVAERVRPKMMTDTAIIAGLLRLLWRAGAGRRTCVALRRPPLRAPVEQTELFCSVTVSQTKHDVRKDVSFMCGNDAS